MYRVALSTSQNPCRLGFASTEHPSIIRPPSNGPGSTGRCIQLFCLKSTRFTVEKTRKPASHVVKKLLFCI